jgi:hypothetical protein
VGVLTDHTPWIHRESVLWHEPSQCDLLFVTLRKSEALFSPTTRTRDLALGSSLFHLESQSTTSASCAAGVVAGAGRLRLMCGSSWIVFEKDPEDAEVAAGAGDPGGVVTGDGVGRLKGTSAFLVGLKKVFPADFRLSENQPQRRPLDKPMIGHSEWRTRTVLIHPRQGRCDVLLGSARIPGVAVPSTGDPEVRRLETWHQPASTVFARKTSCTGSS